MAKGIETFGFTRGRKVGPRYVVESLLGRGREGEVYQIRELDTGIGRAAKFCFPHLDPLQRLSIKHAQKLDTLRHCPIVLQYHHSEVIRVRRERVVAMISDLCEGEQLDRWVLGHRGKRLHPYVALHVFYSLICGLESIHSQGQYHADVHTQNILIRPRGVRFDLKLIDFYDWGRPASYKQQQDVVDAVRVLYDCLGGQRYYAGQPKELKWVCAGMRRKLVLERFPAVESIRKYLESFDWSRMG